MDQFGVLVKNYGIKPQGKSAPMASVKSGAKTHNDEPANSWNSTHDSASQSKSILDDHDDPFNFSSGTRFQRGNDGGFSDFDFGFPSPPQNRTFASKSNSGGGGSTFGVEMMFRDSMNLGSKSYNSNGSEDLLSGFSGKSSGHFDNDDLLSSIPKKVDPIDDIFGNLGGNGSVSKGSNSRSGSSTKGSNEFDEGEELIPGFGKATNTNRGMKLNIKMNKQKPVEANFIDTDISSDNGGLHGGKDDENSDWEFKTAVPADPQLDLDSFFTVQSGKHGSSAPSVASEVEIDSFFSVSKPSTTRVKEKQMPTKKTEVEIDSFFSVSKPSTTRVREKQMPTKKTEVDIDSLFGAPNVKSDSGSTRATSKNRVVPDLFHGTSSHSRNGFSTPSAPYDFGSVFGGPMTSGAFEEIEGENDERRRARFGRYQRTEARMAQAVQDMNSREFQAQQERDERHRIAELKDTEMRLWAAGKEGNLRALLSSLHQVLWPECGWKTLSLTDLITSAQVKVAYKKAALCVHPDKVQQKGADAQQKYVAEKVFDLLKEAWNKFNKEELR